MDDAGVAEAFKVYGGAVYGRCLRVLRDPESARDVTQEVFVRCFDRRTRLRHGRELLGWLYRVATNLCLNALRDGKLRRAADRRLALDLPAATEQPEARLLWDPAGIYVYDGRLRVEVNHISLDALAVSPGRGGFRYSLSADGTTATVSYSTYNAEPVRIAIYRIPDGDLLNMFQLADATNVGELAVSPDGKLLCASAYTNVAARTTVLDTATGTPLWTDGELRRFPVWSADGTTLFTKVDVDAPDSAVQALDARTGTLKWRTEVRGLGVLGLALVGDGALLAAAAEVQEVQEVQEGQQVDCPGAFGCPPVFPFWSATDGTAVMQLPGVPQTHLYAAGPIGGGDVFACNVTDTCAAGLRDYSRPEQPKYAHIYKPDGTVLMTVPTQGATPSIAISPDGKFITMAAEAGEKGGATVFSVADGTVVGSHVFPLDTF